MSMSIVIITVFSGIYKFYCNIIYLLTVRSF